ncbi:MAG TPA: glycoside hydrolase family 27 protein [Candidatus Dormibacteraeota bacterium]|nr:glycoside hydrolase family 27 protein [Candidatus Dormibacteraeota bacterium]
MSHLPRWMGIVSGATLVLVGLLGPAWAPSLRSAAVDAIRINNGQSVLASGEWPFTMPITGRLAPTPPMGWNGFNHFARTVTEATVEAEAQALVTSGMKAAGYAYVNLDGGWDLMQRDANGLLQPDPGKFPHGIKPVADYVHALGLHFGIYASAGSTNCAKTSAGSYGHYREDAATFAAWNVDYVKFDWCYIPFWAYPNMTHRQVSELLAQEMATAIESTNRQMLFDVNDPMNDDPWIWARGMAHMWRTTQDSRDHWWSVTSQFKANVDHHAFAGPGGWNDPDMLEVGNGGMTTTEYQAQFSLWAEMAAPLIAGNDLVGMSPATRAILTNQDVIAVDQDPLGRQGYPVASSGGHWVLTKPLANGDRAVVLFNETNRGVTISTTVEQVGAGKAPQWAVLNLWDGTISQTGGPITAHVEPHGVVMFVVSALRPAGV